MFLLVLVLVLILVSVVLPLAMAWRVARLDEPSLAQWLLQAADAVAIVALVMLLSRWDMAGWHSRTGLVALFAVALVSSLVRHARRPWRGPAGALKARWATAVSLVLSGAALAWVGSGLLPRAGAVNLAFPLRDGTYMVGQGGGVGLLNHHAGTAEQAHAVDITAIGPAGFRADGILPAVLDGYAIFEKPAVSPCAGTVLSIVDGRPDLVPPRRDEQNAAGNTVIVDCGGVSVQLAHLREGSVRVSAGERVAPGAALGTVGNSGNTTEPHLHLHAFDPATGAGVPVEFDGRTPVRNARFERG